MVFIKIILQGLGGVMASPDTDVGVAGSYYYDWARDGALSMRSFM
jgi:glucoamylase